jgi:uncharacterized membrane protein YkoI
MISGRSPADAQSRRGPKPVLTVSFTLRLRPHPEHPRMLRPLLLIALYAFVPAHAGEHDAVRRAVEAGEIRPLAEILATVQARYPGRILDVEIDRARDGRRVYDIELLDADGRKIEVSVDAATGALIEPETVGVDALLPLSQILRAVLADHPGQIVDVELERDREDRAVYEVELLTADGRTLELVIDARSGQPLDDGSHGHPAGEPLRPLPDILDQLRASHPGTVVEVELERDRAGRRYYEIDIRDADGRTLELRIDAVTGVILHEGEAD